jgi:hypothetical protein
LAGLSGLPEKALEAVLLRAGKLFFWGLGLNVAGRMVQTMSGPRIWILYGTVARSPLPHWSAGKSVGQVIAVFGGSLMALAVVVVLTRFTKTKMPAGTSTAAAVMIEIAAYGFWVLLPLLLVTLVTQGANLSAVDAAAVNRGGHGFAAQLLGAIRYNFPLVPLFILGAVPTLLRRWLPWTRSSDRFRSLVPSWLAAAAAILTWLYIVFLHFGGGALARLSLGAVIVGGLLVALTLVPLFQFVARSGWKYGPVRMLDPLRWGSAFRDFFDEVREARALRDSGKVGEPEPTEDPDAGSQEGLQQGPDRVTAVPARAGADTTRNSATRSRAEGSQPQQEEPRRQY